MGNDAWGGFGALTCRECGTSLELRWRRRRVTVDCLECGTSMTVARRAPHRSWFAPTAPAEIAQAPMRASASAL